MQWNKVLPIPKTNAERFPEVKKLTDLRLQSKQFTFNLAAQSEAGRIFQGMSPSNDGTTERRSMPPIRHPRASPR